jgi:hypothetical protein
MREDTLYLPENEKISSWYGTKKTYPDTGVSLSPQIRARFSPRFPENLAGKTRKTP